MKKPFLWLQYVLAAMAALTLVAGTYYAAYTWLPAIGRKLPTVVGENFDRSYPLHEAAADGAAGPLKSLLAGKADVNEQDDMGYTPLMYAAENGRAQAVRLLLQAGADVSLTDKITVPGYDPVAVLEEASPDFRARDQAYKEQFREEMKNLPGETAMAKAASGEIVRLLQNAGADIASISDETRGELTGLESEGEIDSTLQDFQKGKAPRPGKANPEKMNVPFWNAMVASGATAAQAREKFGAAQEAGRNAVWCFKRFGKSLTFLPDGRIIEIGGEHEDFYDTDFHIYNDVIVHHGNGRFEIFGYPETVFPPTDFHTATLAGNHIYIIGGLGYPPDRRPGFTPVYRLNCKTLAIEKVSTGGDNPGWIQHHQATYRAGKGKAGEIHVKGGTIYQAKSAAEKENWADNQAAFVLDLASLRWRKERDGR